MDSIFQFLILIHSYQNLILPVFFTVNSFSFLLFAIDKYNAVRYRRRIPELYLLIAAVLFGAPGELVAMVTLRHKIRKPKFRFILPLLSVIYVGIVFLAVSLKAAGVYGLNAN